METLLQPPKHETWPFTPEEEEDMFFNSLLAELNTLNVEFVSAEDTRRQDEEILAAVASVYQAGAEHVDGDFAKTMNLFSQFEARLGAMEALCNHNHLVDDAFSKVEEQKNSQNSGQLDPNQNQKLNEENDKKDKEKKKSKRKKNEKSVGKVAAKKFNWL